MKTLRGVALVAAVVLLSGCAGAEPQSAETVTVTVTATPEPAPTVTVTATPTPEALPAPDDIDVAVREASGAVTSAVEVEPGRWTIETSIVDPRVDGSAEAAEAIEICEAAVDAGAEYVSVMESDGTTFVLYGHPSYGNTCTEV